MRMVEVRSGVGEWSDGCTNKKKNEDDVMVSGCGIMDDHWMVHMMDDPAVEHDATIAVFRYMVDREKMDDACESCKPFFAGVDSGDEVYNLEAKQSVSFGGDGLSTALGTIEQLTDSLAAMGEVEAVGLLAEYELGLHEKLRKQRRAALGLS